MSEFASGANQGLSFIVRNTAPERKYLNIFNISIPNGSTLDLMKVEGISEYDVKTSILKGDVGAKLKSGYLKVVSSTLVFDGLDSNYSNILVSYGLSANTGSSGNSHVTNLASLSLINDADELDGSEREVSTLLHSFKLDKSSSATVDGITVLATKSGTGRWVRTLSHIPKWTNQLTWYQSNTSGSDENDGATALTPVKTLAEITRRLRVIQMATYTINQLDSVVSTDTLDLCPQFDGSQSSVGTLNATINVVGIQTVDVSGTAAGNGTTTLGTNPATNQQAQLDGGFSWASHVGKLVVMTSGALSGYQAFVIKDLGSNTARLTNWWLPGSAPATNGTFASTGNGSGAAPQNGDTFEIRTLSTFDGSFKSSGIPTRLLVNFKNINFSSTSNVVVEGFTCSFISCQILNAFNFATGHSWNAWLRCFGTLLNPNGGRIRQFDCRTRYVAGGFLNMTFTVFNTGRAEFIGAVVQSGNGGQAIISGRGYTGFTGDTSEIGGQIAVFAGTYGLGIYDVAGSAFLTARGAMNSFDAVVYGSGNTVGFEALEGSKTFKRTGLTMTLTGTTELKVEGAATAIPPLSGGASVPAASALTTWANLDASPFSGNVMNYKTGTSISTVAAPV